MADLIEWGDIDISPALNVDVVFVIDATLSMRHTISLIKSAALRFQSELNDTIKASGRTINRLRVKVIWFRDFYFDSEFAYGESCFYDLPEQNADFQSFVNSITEGGGGGLDDDETSLEALSLAMRSDFNQDGRKKRHIIVLFTDSGAHPFEQYDKFVRQAEEEGCTNMQYPPNMPKSLQEFISLWNGSSSSKEHLKLDANGKRLILFAPDAYPWDKLELQMYVQHSRIALKQGCKEIDLDLLYNTLLHSIN